MNDARTAKTHRAHRIARPRAPGASRPQKKTRIERFSRATHAARDGDAPLQSARMPHVILFTHTKATTTRRRRHPSGGCARTRVNSRRARRATGHHAPIRAHTSATRFACVVFAPRVSAYRRRRAHGTAQHAWARDSVGLHLSDDVFARCGRRARGDAVPCVWE